MFNLKFFLCVVLCVLIVSCSETQNDNKTEVKLDEESAGYNPESDPFKDLEAVIAKTSVSGQRILLEVGGDWCIWCHRLEEFIHQNQEVEVTISQNYVLLKVNYSKENKNEKFLAKYPKIDGYPHIFVLESDGTLLHSQNTGELEAGKGYDVNKIIAFLNKWKPVS